MNNLTLKLREVKDIRETEGLISLLKRVFLRLVHTVFWHEGHTLMAQNIEEHLSLDESEFKPDIENLTLKIITSNQEADELEAEGFDFRSYPTTWNKDLKLYRKRLDQGAIAFCTFVGYELAAIQWGVLNQQVHDRIDVYPQKIDYGNGEACCKGAWANPKYRRLGLFRYGSYFHRDPYLVERGITTLLSGPSHNNKLGYQLALGMGFKPYAKAHYVKLLLWKFWKEIPLQTDQ